MVSFRPGLTKPYKLRVLTNGRSKTKYYATEREAIVAQLSGRICKRVVKQIARETLTLAEKRAHDLEKYGQNSAMERQVAEAMAVEWRLRTGAPAIVLNDGTRADVLFGLDDARFLPMQLKTTSGKKADRENSWEFQDVSGYKGIPVVCWRRDCEDAWVYDGAALDGRKGGLLVTIGGKNEALAMAKQLGMAGVVQYLHKHASRWTTVTEHAGRHDFPSRSHAKEMRGIDAFRAAFPEGCYRWPLGQNTHVDLLDGEVRIQFKTACVKRGHAGFYVDMSTSSGTDFEGRATKLLKNTRQQNFC